MIDDADFTDAFCEFLQFSVPAVEAAEMLLVLQRHPDRTWSPEELVASLEPDTTLSVPEATRHLDLFHARGLIVRGDDGRVRYRPANEQLDDHVHTLAKLYNERPVTLIRVIYALRDRKIKSFADAFKLRR